MRVSENKKHRFSRCSLHFKLTFDKRLRMFPFDMLAFGVWTVVMDPCSVLGVHVSERVVMFFSIAIQWALTDIQAFALVLSCQSHGNAFFAFHGWSRGRLEYELPLYQ
jgi:hypothetical protein